MPLVIVLSVVVVTSTACLVREYRSRSLAADAERDPVVLADDEGDEGDLRAA